jgi:hypothetical protein
MLIAALFIITKKGKQPNWPSADEWINKMWSIHTLEYYLTIKRNEALIYPIRVDEPWKHFSTKGAQNVAVVSIYVKYHSMHTETTDRVQRKESMLGGKGLPFGDNNL